MVFNVATTLSFSAAATCLSLCVLGAYLGRAATSRHFSYAAAAGLAATVYCVTNAIFAARVGLEITIWAARVSFVAGLGHHAFWLAFLAAWDRRRLSRTERVFIGASAFASLVALVPGLAVLDTVKDRTSLFLGVTYRDPEPGPLCLPILALIFGGQVLSMVSALRISRTNSKARVVGVALGLICVASIVDAANALCLTDLPYLADPAFAFALLSIGTVVVGDAAESAVKSAELDRARVVLAERENLAAVGQLAAVVAHEVRNPVAIIFGALASLQRLAAAGDEEGKLLAIVAEEAERLNQLVARLLDAVRPFELQCSRGQVSQIVAEAISHATEGAGVAASEVVLVSAPSGEIECDGILLGQAISNLVQNALVANGRTSPVRVSARVDRERPAMLHIEVSDDGDGVPVEARPRLFTPFFTTRATGTGLGLALVKRIAGAHGGTVEYEPRGERGATFVMRVPIRVGEVSPRRLLGGEVQ